MQPNYQCDNLNLDSHIILTQSSHPNTGPYRAVIRHPLLEVSRHSGQYLVVWYVVENHKEVLRLTLVPCVFRNWRRTPRVSILLRPSLDWLVALDKTW